MKSLITRMLLGLLILSSCGYHFEGGERTTIAVPYVIGDQEGELTAALIRQISQSPTLSYSHGEGNWILNVKIINVSDERIGFRHDRSPVTEKLRKHLEGIEDRRRVTAEVVIISSSTEEIIYGPQIVSAEMDYDYVDPNSLKDLSVQGPNGKFFPVEGFSLGQLDTIDAAKSDCLRPLYRKLAQKIIDGITTCCE